MRWLSTVLGSRGNDTTSCTQRTHGSYHQLYLAPDQQWTFTVIIAHRRDLKRSKLNEAPYRSIKRWHYAKDWLMWRMCLRTSDSSGSVLFSHTHADRGDPSVGGTAVHLASILFCRMCSHAQTHCFHISASLNLSSTD